MIFFITYNMKYIFIFILLGSGSILSAQEYFAQDWDSGETADKNFILSSQLYNDSIYYLSFNVCYLSDEIWEECNTLGVMDNKGNIIQERNLGWVSTSKLTKPLHITDTEIFIAGRTQNLVNPKIQLTIIDKNDWENHNVFLYDLGLDVDNYFSYGVITYSNYIIVTGDTKLKNENTFPDWMLWIDRSTMEIDTIIEYPFMKRSVRTLFLDIDKNNLLTCYFVGRDNRFFESGNLANSRGFIKYNDQKEVVFHYLDTLDGNTGLNYVHTGLLLENQNMVYKQAHFNDEPFGIGNDPDYEVICVKPSGERLWRFKNPGFSNYGEKRVNSISEASNGDVLLCGSMDWRVGLGPGLFETNWLDTIPDPTHPHPDSLGALFLAPYIARLDGETGEMLWQYALMDIDSTAESFACYLSEFYEMEDGSYTGLGAYCIPDTLNNGDDSDSWVVRLPPEICFSGEMECGLENYLTTSTMSIIPIEDTQEKSYRIYPNPTSDKLFLEPISPERGAYVQITSIDGSLLFRDEFIGNAIDISRMESGLLIIQLLNKQGHIIQVEKIVKQ